MKKLLSILFLFIYTGVTAQLSEKQLNQLHENTAKAESSRVRLEAGLKETQRAMDSINRDNFNKQNIRNLNAFMAQRKVQEQKAEKRMYWRLGFGVLMVVVLVVGWRRKKEKK
jgi:hypothetical protein